MNLSQAQALLDEQGVHADPKHTAASAAAVTSLLKAVAQPFSKQPLEAEPSGFQAEQRRAAP
jgi:hypothetical protein